LNIRIYNSEIERQK